MISEAIQTRLIDDGGLLVTAVLVALIARGTPKKLTEEVKEVHKQVNSNLALVKAELAGQRAAVLQLTGELKEMIGYKRGFEEQK